MPPVVWLNEHLSNTWESLALVRRVRRAGEFRLHCTHHRPRYRGRLHADHFEPEPVGLDDTAYVEYCVDYCKRHAVGLFLPGRRLLPILRRRDRFADVGTRLLAAGDAAAVEAVSDKARAYAALADGDVPVPEYAVVTDVPGFDAALGQLRRHALVCYKPAVSVFGIGFRILADAGRCAGQVHGPWTITVDEARQALARRRPFGKLLVMQYLPGPERSVDCLAVDGRLVRCVVRRKHDGGQVLEHNPAVVELVRRLTARLRLTHLFNVQFRDAGGTPYLLEINPRMSGGLPFACRSGLAFLYWAIRLALGTATADDVPHPRAGLWVPRPAVARSV